MKLGFHISILVFALSVFSGCTTTPTLNDIPHTNEDFHRPPDELVTIYPLVFQNQVDFPLAAFNSQTTTAGLHVPIKLLEDGWGHASDIGNGSWLVHVGAILSAQVVGYLLAGAPPIPVEVHVGLFGGFYLYAPFPAQTYTWIKGDYCIKARTVRNANTYYKKEVSSWIWAPKDDCLKGSG